VVDSESKFLLEFIMTVLLYPITLILVLLGKRSGSELLKPITLPVRFMVQAKATALMMLVLVIVYFAEVFLITDFSNLVFRPEHIWTLSYIPLIASWFLHASLVHLGGNLLFLFVFGRVVEGRLGTFWFVGIYFFSALTASVLSGLMGQGGIGASGAIAGLVATAMLLAPLSFTYAFGIPLPLSIIGFIAIGSDITGITTGVQDGIGHFAHLGGYLAVTFFMFVVSRKERQNMKLGLVVNIIMVLVWVGYIIFGPQLFYNNTYN